MSVPRRIGLLLPGTPVPSDMTQTQQKATTTLPSPGATQDLFPQVNLVVGPDNTWLSLEWWHPENRGASPLLAYRVHPAIWHRLDTP